MTTKQAGVKKYVVKRSDEERERLNTLIHKGKHRAGQLMRARILLTADASETDEGWSGGEIAAALDTSVNTVARTRQQLVEEGFEPVLIRKPVARGAVLAPQVWQALAAPPYRFPGSYHRQSTNPVRHRRPRSSIPSNPAGASGANHRVASAAVYVLILTAANT